jgi:hypothetical protein
MKRRAPFASSILSNTLISSSVRDNFNAGTDNAVLIRSVGISAEMLSMAPAAMNMPLFADSSPLSSERESLIVSKQKNRIAAFAAFADVRSVFYSGFLLVAASHID